MMHGHANPKFIALHVLISVYLWEANGETQHSMDVLFPLTNPHNDDWFVTKDLE